MKRLISALLVVLMLLSLVGCGQNETPGASNGEDQPDFYEVNGVSYPAALGAPVLGEAAAELFGSVSFLQAAREINNVGDMLYFLLANGQCDQPFEVFGNYAELLAGDYDEVGMVYLERTGDSYSVLYVKIGDIYYTVDPFSAGEEWPAAPIYGCSSGEDLNALCNRLKETCPYAVMTGCHSEPVVVDEQYSETEYEIIDTFATPQYTKAQIEQWVADGLTLDEWAEKISTPADAVQMLRAIRYRENADTAPDDNHGFLDASDVNWCGIWNAHLVFAYRNGNCGGTSTIFNYLLAGDFDEQGYVEFSSAAGGHIFNYFVLDGSYIVCDFVGIPGINFYASEESGAYYAVDVSTAILYITDDAYEFGEWYHNEGPFASNFENPNSKDYLYSLFMYPCEGSKLPKGMDENSLRTQFNVVCDILPEQHKDDYTILYEREGYPIRFAPIPDKSAWPAEIR